MVDASMAVKGFAETPSRKKRGDGNQPRRAGGLRRGLVASDTVQRTKIRVPQ